MPLKLQTVAGAKLPAPYNYYNKEVLHSSKEKPVWLHGGGRGGGHESLSSDEDVETHSLADQMLYLLHVHNYHLLCNMVYARYGCNLPDRDGTFAGDICPIHCKGH